MGSQSRTFLSLVFNAKILTPNTVGIWAYYMAKNVFQKVSTKFQHWTRLKKVLDCEPKTFIKQYFQFFISFPFPFYFLSNSFSICFPFPFLFLLFSFFLSFFYSFGFPFTFPFLTFYFPFPFLTSLFPFLLF